MHAKKLIQGENLKDIKRKTAIRGSLIVLISVVIIFGSAAKGPEWHEEPISGQAPNASSYLSGNGSSTSALLGDNDSHKLSASPESSQFFRMEGTKTDILVFENLVGSCQEPKTILLGPNEYPYQELKPLISATNSLWITGAWAWTQQAICPLSATIDLKALCVAPGQGYLYQIHPGGMAEKRTLNFTPCNKISFYGLAPGRYILLFLAGDQPSNSVVIDVVQTWPPRQGTFGDSPVSRLTVVSPERQGFDVELDGNQKYRDTDDGFLDGRVSISLKGDATHRIKVSRGGTIFSQNRFFQNGVAYTLFIP